MYLKHKVSPQRLEEKTENRHGTVTYKILSTMRHIQRARNLRLAKRGVDAKAIHRANMGENKTVNATDEDRERHVAAQDYAATSSGFEPGRQANRTAFGPLQQRSQLSDMLTFFNHEPDVDGQISLTVTMMTDQMGSWNHRTRFQKS